MKYLHCPIAEGMAPSDGLGERSGPLLALLDQMLLHYEGGGRAIYLHSWAGCGRAGLVGASLLSLLRPDLEAAALLEWVLRHANDKPCSLRLRPPGSPEASFSARACLRLPQSSASLGQSTAWAALAGHVQALFSTQVQSAYESRACDVLPTEAVVSGVCAKPHLRSPQTEPQRRFVASFVGEVRAAHGATRDGLGT